MMEQVCNSDNANLCKQILAIITIVYRPITLKELTSFVEMLEIASNDLESLTEIIELCWFISDSSRKYDPFCASVSEGLFA